MVKEPSLRLRSVTRLPLSVQPTINLNAEEYEGGDLRFPEFGQATYRAPTGGAVVFSCSLLHEATPVTKGTRYGFLPFLYNDEAAQIREENSVFLTGKMINQNNS